MLRDTLHLGNKTVEVFDDEYSEDNPRDWDNLGTMAFFHRRYNLGDDHGFAGTSDLLDFLEEEDPIYLPVHMYDHSGIALSTSDGYPFNDPWDAGLLGFIYIERDDIRSEYGWINLTGKRIGKILSYLRSEVETYNLFVQGRVYYFIATCDLCEETDSCGGFFGEDWEDNGLVEHADYPCECESRAYAHTMEVVE